MKLKKLLLSTIILSTATYAGLDQAPKLAPFSPTIQITKNLITIMPDAGKTSNDSGENVTSYLLEKINKGNIVLDNGTNIEFCGEKTYIISIGINNYKKLPSLTNAISDSKNMANTIANNCKNISNNTLQNATKKNIMTTLEDISKQATSKDTIVFYFSGHRVMINNKSYIAPVEAKTKTPIDIQYSFIDMSDISKLLESSRIKSGLIIFDAGRTKIFKVK